MSYLKSSSSTSQWLLLATMLFLLNSWPVFAQQPQGQLRTVTRVIDGDTVVLENGETVRLIGVDTPETQHPQKAVENFGKEASAFTRNLVEGQRVWIETDPANAHLGHKDRYGRTLGYVWNERGKFVNAEIIEQGYGHSLTKYPFKYRNEFRGLEQHAWQQRRGLWSNTQSSGGGVSYRQLPSYTTERNTYAPNANQFRSSAQNSNRRIDTTGSGTGQEQSLRSSPDVNRPVVGHTVTGIPIYQGPRGGHYHITSGGHKSYHSRSGGSRSGGRR